MYPSYLEEHSFTAAILAAKIFDIPGKTEEEKIEVITNAVASKLKDIMKPETEEKFMREISGMAMNKLFMYGHFKAFSLEHPEVIAHYKSITEPDDSTHIEALVAFVSDAINASYLQDADSDVHANALDEESIAGKFAQDMSCAFAEFLRDIHFTYKHKHKRVH